MRQIWIPKHGKPDVLEIREAPDPTPKSDEVRIRVAYSGVNFADIVARLGMYADAPRPPLVPGYEVSGQVDAIGAGVEDPLAWENARVMAITRFGGYSDIVCVPTSQVFKIPDGMPFDDAAALPIGGLTAYQALVAMGRLNSGDTVLIHGAAGGMGIIACQIAEVLGANVYATASPQKHEALFEIGVQECIDYRSQDFEAEVMKLTKGKGVNLVLDPIGGGHWRKSYRVLAPTGRLVMHGQAGMVTGTRRNPLAMLNWLRGMPNFGTLKLINENKGVMGVNLGKLWGEAERLRPWILEIMDWYEKGWLKPRIDRVYPFEEAAQAHQHIQDRANIGKVLLRAESDL